jgi:transposase-like protein
VYNSLCKLFRNKEEIPKEKDDDKDKQKHERDALDEIFEQIDFKGLTQEEILGEDGLVRQLTGRLLQKVLDAEMTVHLGYEKNSTAGDNSGDSRNGYSEKRILMENQSSTIRVPRDRQGTFGPQKNSERV